MEKYLVASSGDTLESKISGRFGHSPYYLIVDPGTMEFDVLPGVDSDEYQHVGRFVKSGISKVIVGNIGPSAYSEIISFGCSVYLCRKMTVREAVKKVADGEISPIGEPTLADSIHSAGKTGGRGGQGKGRGTGRSLGSGSGGGRGMGRGSGGGMGGGRGRGWS